jgi:NuA3 HAT complex component NTO1
MEAFTSMEITRRNFAGMGAAGGPRLQRRIEFAKQLEGDMEQIRALCQEVREREKKKLEDVKILKDILDCIYFPIPKILQPILTKAQALDPKGIFAEGFDELQRKLDEKYYTSVQSFSEDISSVFSSVIGFATITNVGEAEHQLSDVAHSSLTSEQKQIKALAKRIIKAIQPGFEDALRKESDLAGKPLERELPDLEALLDQRLGRSSASTELNHTVRPSTETGHVNGTENGQLVPGHLEKSPKSHGTLQLAPTPEDNSAEDHHRDSRDEAADEAAIAAQFSQDAMHSTAPEAMEVDHQEAPSGGAVAPLTPPRSEKDLLAPLANGGIPWYMEAFDPVGTTVHEEKWTGRDVLRDMSEELSELDDDELHGLVGAESMQLTDGARPESETSAIQAVARKARRRSRAYR